MTTGRPWELFTLDVLTAPGAQTPTTASPRTGHGEIRSLTGLRGIAAVTVMLYHFSLSVPAGTLLLGDVLHNGYLCVDLFFVLSGFVMAYSQRRAFEGGYRLRNHLLYLSARLARIYPLYALITLESFCSLLWRGRDGGLFQLGRDGDLYQLGRVLLLNLGLVQAWGLAPSLEGATWSISTEWAAYLLFPLLLALSVSASRRAALATAAAALLGVVLVATWPGPVGGPGQARSGPLDVYSPATVLPLLRCLAEFTLGLFTFRLAPRLAAPCFATTIRPWAGPLGWLAVAALALLFAQTGADVAIVALFPVLIVLLVPQEGTLDGLLASTAPYRLGQWSYSIYLVHDKFSHVAAGLRDWLAPRIPLASEVAVLLVAAPVIAVGALSFHLIERPLRTLLGRAARRARREALDSPPVAPPPIAMAGS